MKKIFIIMSLIFLISCNEVKKDEQVVVDTSNLNAYGWSVSENVCSSGLMNMMTDMGLMAYSMADFMSNMCTMMPFGGMCPDLSKMAAKFFNKVLDNPQLTIDLLDCSDRNEGMRSFMLKIMAENRWLLTKIAYIMKQNDNDYACLFTEKFTKMAITHEDIRNFFFYFVNNDLYKSLTYADLCENETSLNVSILMKDYGAEEMQPRHSFGKVFMNLGTLDDDNDANEMANERLFYSMFSSVDTANNFFAALSNMPQEMQKAFMDFFFMGDLNVTEQTCTPIEEMRGCVPRDAGVINYTKQGYYNLYAIIKAFVTKIAPLYNMELPPDPNSDNEANALFGKFMSMLMTENGEMTPYANKFFSTIITASSPPYCNEDAKAMMMMFQSMMQQGFLPFSLEQFQTMAQNMYDENAPKPRNFIDGSGGEIIGVCPNLPCTNDSPQGCSDSNSCENLGLNWCDSYCTSGSCPSCDIEHLSLCIDETTCNNAGGYFCDNTCVNEACPQVSNCDTEHLDLCDNSNSCSNARGIWCNNHCSANNCNYQELAELGERCDYYHPCEENLSCYRIYGDMFSKCVAPASEAEQCNHFYPCKNKLVCEFNRDNQEYLCKKLKTVGENCEWNIDCERNLYCDYNDKKCKSF